MFFSRGPNKIQNPYTWTCFYDQYNIDTKGNALYNVDKEVYKKILFSSFKKLASLVVDKGRIIKLPFHLGELFVEKSLPKKLDSKSLSIDFKTTNELGKVVYHMNEHSNGYRHGFKWSKLKGRVKYITYYRFDATRHNKRNLAKNVKQGYSYLEK